MNNTTQRPPGIREEEFLLPHRIKKTPVWSLLPGVALATITAVGIAAFFDINDFESELSYVVFLAIPIGLGLLVIFGLPPLLQHYSPTVTVWADKTEAQMGENISIGYEISGPLQRLRRVRITFEGALTKWEGQRARGVPKSHTTWRPARERCFVEEPVVDTSDVTSMAFGQHTVKVPFATVPTIRKHDGSQRIEWWIRVRGDARFLPNVDERFPIEVITL